MDNLMATMTTTTPMKTTTMTKRWMTLLLAPVFALALAGCDGASTGGSVSDGGTPDTPGVGDAGGDPAAVVEDVVLLGRWEVLSQNGTLVRAGELSFSFYDDGSGMSLEGTSEKAFSWEHDPAGQTLHIETDNEDLSFSVAMAGQTLTLVGSDPPMTLVLRRAAEAGDE